MNQTIYTFAEQAAEHALLNPSTARLQSEAEGYDTISVPKEFIDKFAELIVRECSAYCQKQGLAPSVFSAEDLLEHFGVEL